MLEADERPGEAVNLHSEGMFAWWGKEAHSFWE
jgi:hypothetical protein